MLAISPVLRIKNDAAAIIAIGVVARIHVEMAKWRRDRQ